MSDDLTILIGLFGPPRVGKTTVTNHLIIEHGFTPLSIPQLIRKEAHAIVGREFGDEEKDVPFDELNGQTPRDFYMHLGDIDEYVSNYWIDKVLKVIHGYRGGRYVIESVGKQFQWNRVLETLPTPKVHLWEITRSNCHWSDSREPIKDSRDIMTFYNGSGLNSLYSMVDDEMRAVVQDRKQRTAGEIWEFLQSFDQAE